MEFVNYLNDLLQFCPIYLPYGLQNYGKCLDVSIFSKAWKGRRGVECTTRILPKYSNLSTLWQGLP